MAPSEHLLFELGSEELPPKTLLVLRDALLAHVVRGLREASLAFTDAKAFATPRRLAVLVENLTAVQAGQIIEKRGPAMQAAFAADGSPTQAALGFARSCGVAVGDLQRVATDKGEWLAFHQAVAGREAVELIPDLVRQAIAALPIAKRMRWSNFATEFVRPAHWLVLLYGSRVIETEILGLPAGALTYGHRFHRPEPIALNHAGEYAETLYRQGKVIADFDRRRNLIRTAAEQAAAGVNGQAHIEDELLAEVTSLSEWPVPILGHFDPRFLDLPKEVLITTMQTNQKYFPVMDRNGQLLARFITFSNIESTRPDSIRAGNERVITPRLTDAEFFWNQDRRKTLAERVDSLNAVVFQEKLGTVGDKTRRVMKLAEAVAERLGVDPAPAKRAALLAKTDLLTEMVGEFANLQGIMGRYYALADHEPEDVALALEQQYWPKYSGGPTPSTPTGRILALAEKLDTLTGIFSAGLIPTGDKDPYALRRAALGLLRIVIEHRLDLNLNEMIDCALDLFSHNFDKTATAQTVSAFVFERLKGYCLDQGHAVDEFEAVAAVEPAEPHDFMRRLAAVKSFRRLPEADSLAAANKRIINLLKKSPETAGHDLGELALPQEKQLLAAARQTGSDIKPLLSRRDYQAALARLALLKPDVDAFFDHVMVMTDDDRLRTNRLALLSMVAELFLSCADISRLQPGGA